MLTLEKKHLLLITKDDLQNLLDYAQYYRGKIDTGLTLPKNYPMVTPAIHQLLNWINNTAIIVGEAIDEEYPTYTANEK